MFKTCSTIRCDNIPMVYQAFRHQIWWVMVCYDLVHQINVLSTLLVFGVILVCCLFGVHSTFYSVHLFFPFSIKYFYSTFFILPPPPPPPPPIPDKHERNKLYLNYPCNTTQFSLIFTGRDPSLKALTLMAAIQYSWLPG